MLDAQNVVAVAQYAEGIAEVIDELRVRTMEQPNGNGSA
jgi:hypothetical protein